jgi:hypothetical protein
MRYAAEKATLAMLGAVVFALSLTALSCATSKAISFKEEPGYIYGQGSAGSMAEAEAAARTALIAAGLGADPENFALNEELARSVKLPSLKPFLSEKGKDSFAVVYRLAKADWDKLELARRQAIRAELAPAFASLRGDGTSPSLERSIADAGRLLVRLEREALTAALTETEGGSVLLSRSIEDYCRGQLEGASFSVLPAGGLIEDSTSFEVMLSAKDGKGLAAIPIAISWKNASGKVLGAAVSTTTDSKGSVTISFPKGDEYSGQEVLRLSLDSAFSAKTPEAGFLKELDQLTLKELRYVHLPDLKKAFLDDAKIPGGEFTAGAVAQDKRAEKKEAPRQAKVASFYIDRELVTNAQYRAFLEDSGAPASAYPEYWDNPDYNAPDQPVIGVSAADAARFAEWVSARMGCKKRLPTENEWERAARGGAEAIYPWGDQSPAGTARANYNGNGRFDGPSPVGSFEEGKNAYGLYDMAGNVWEWTSTAGSSGSAIVKGGSWMDGPSELRVSNRRELASGEGYSDVGFRLVREVSNE